MFVQYALCNGYAICAPWFISTLRAGVGNEGGNLTLANGENECIHKYTGSLPVFIGKVGSGMAI